MNTMNLISLEDIKELRAKSEKVIEKQKLKGALFSGYNKKEVDKYVSSLKEREENVRETLSGRISELEASLEKIRQERDSLSGTLADAIKAKEENEGIVAQLRNNDLIIRRKIENDGQEIAALKEKCGDYEREIEKLAVDNEELENAKKIKLQYLALETELSELSEKLDGQVRKTAAAEQENKELKTEWERLKAENSILNKRITEIISLIRKGRINTFNCVGEFEEKQRFCLEAIQNSLDVVMRNFNEIRQQSDGFKETIQTNIDVFKV